MFVKMEKKGMKILVPTDCSDLSGIALKAANQLAKKFDADIVALKVINAPVGSVFNEDGELVDEEEFDTTAIKEEQRTSLDQIKLWAAMYQVKVSPVVKTGLMIDTILHMLEVHDFDLVVMNSDSTSGLKKMVHGPIVERIVLNSRVPILTIKEYFNAFQNIAFANNFRRLDIKIGMIKEIQEAFNSTLHLVRVNTPRKFMSENEAKQGMQDLVDKHGLRDVVFHCIDGKRIDSALSDFCKIYKIDMMAIGSKQRKGLISVMRGCPSKEIVNELEFPVLTFQSK